VQYKTPGRHAQVCKGKPSASTATKRAAARLAAPGPEATAALNGYSERVAVFETATRDMVSLLREVLTEVEVYKRDSVELQTMRQQLSVMFQRPAVPR